MPALHCVLTRGRSCSSEERRALSLMRNCVQAGRHITEESLRGGEYTPVVTILLTLRAARDVKKIVSSVIEHATFEDCHF